MNEWNFSEGIALFCSLRLLISFQAGFDGGGCSQPASQPAPLSSPAARVSRLGQLRLSQFALQIHLNGFFLLPLNGCCCRAGLGKDAASVTGSGTLTGPLVPCPSPEQPRLSPGDLQTLSAAGAPGGDPVGAAPAWRQWELPGGNTSPPLSGTAKYREGSGKGGTPV